MTISWPPYGRWAAGYGTDQAALAWVPKSQIAGKVGYSMPPGGHPQLAAGFALSIASASQKKDPAYLFIQWLNSEEISLQRVQLPYALRDPFRDDHFTSDEYKSRWPEAPQYLAALNAGAINGLLELVGDPDRQVRGGAAPGHLRALGRPGSARRSSTRSPPSGTRSPSASASTSSGAAYEFVGRQAQRLPDRIVTQGDWRPPSWRAPVAGGPTASSSIWRSRRP